MVTSVSAASHGAVVLAAGASTRLSRAKQLVEIDGEPLLRRVARCALATRPRECVVVLSEGGEHFETALEGLEVRVVRIADAATGMSAALRAGIGALDAQCSGALVVVTDQPALAESHLHALCEKWRAAPQRAAASAYAGVIGVPALLPRSWFADVAALHGDVGARDLLRSRAGVIAIAAPALAHDIDVPGDMAGR
ncbi:MAG TPA: nucleotidyltransferase family protein [Rhodanobacteraceae bacterium]|nr:nucleotidyltransferase family protein [Rhodanobacteraceae bacterium]